MTSNNPIIEHLTRRGDAHPVLGELWALYIYDELGVLLGLSYDQNRQTLADKLEDIKRLLPALSFTSRLVTYHINTDEGVQ
jgi:hypothetical protein